MIPVGGVILMRSLKKLGQENTVFLILILLPFSGSPFVIAGTIDVHDTAQIVYRVLYSEFFDNFVVLPFPVTYSLFAPAPSTQYPFFNLAFSISSFATMRRKRSTSDNDLLVCSAANRFPGRPLGMNACSPSARYSFTHLQIMLRSAVNSFSSVLTETCSSKCLCTICAFCSGVHIRFFCPFFILLTSNSIIA